ncbi:MAG: aspartate kinase [Spirochaetota bacterium]
MSNRRVMKFGGTSLQNPERIARAADIVAANRKDSEPLIVLSAMGGVTNTLDDAAGRAAAGDSSYEGLIEELKRRHLEAVERLVPADEKVLASIPILNLISELGDILRGVELVRECSPRTRDLVLSFGERMSCLIFAGYLAAQGTPARAIDARDVIVSDDAHGNAGVDSEETAVRLERALTGRHDVPVITGFIASTREGVTTTLGRNGSDYTASIVAAAMKAEVIEIWTDVDGVLSADPRYVPDAFVLDEITFQEAMELSYFGAKVIHPYTMIPAVEHGIPVRIRNTFNPQGAGTWIREIRGESGPRVATGIASVENVALINIEGGGMVGMPGVASKVFTALAHAGVNIIMISQASSEHSICVVCRQEQASAALASLRVELASELASKKIQRFELLEDLEIVAVIGERMRGTPGISAQVFGALGKERINVLAIAQGSSEMNISFVVHGADRERTLQVVHQAFFGPEAP